MKVIRILRLRPIGVPLFQMIFLTRRMASFASWIRLWMSESTVPSSLNTEPRYTNSATLLMGFPLIYGTT